MAVRVSALYKNHNSTLYIDKPNKWLRGDNSVNILGMVIVQRPS